MILLLPTPLSAYASLCLRLCLCLCVCVCVWVSLSTPTPTTLAASQVMQGQRGAVLLRPLPLLPGPPLAPPPPSFPHKQNQTSNCRRARCEGGAGKGGAGRGQTRSADIPTCPRRIHGPPRALAVLSQDRRQRVPAVDSAAPRTAGQPVQAGVPAASARLLWRASQLPSAQ